MSSLDYSNRGTTCSGDDCHSYLLNEFGMCAYCWSFLSDEKIQRIVGDRVKVREVTHTIYKPFPSTLTVIGISVGTSVFTVIAIAWAIWFFHWYLR